MQVKALQTAFTTGEISPRLYGRVDLDQYYSGAEELTNFIATPQGPIIRRPGTTFINELPKPATADVRLVPFVFNVDQSFVLAFSSDGYIYFFFKGGAIYKDNALYKVSHGYSADELREFDYAQSGDTVYIAHSKHLPRKLLRKANDNWVFENESFVSQPTQWTTNNYPTLVTFFEQRLIYAATPKEPQTIWMSRIALFNDFNKEGPDEQVLDDMAIEYTIASDDVNGIMWLAGLDILLIGTAGAEYKASSSVLGEALTPTNIKITKITTYGSAKTRAVPLGLGIAYVQRSRQVIRHVGPDAIGTYNSSDITLLANHLCIKGIKELALQTNPSSILWCLTEDGNLLGCSYDKDNKVLSWHRHTVGGDRRVLGITVIPGDGGKDQVWLATTYNDTAKGAPNLIFIEALLTTATETEKVEDSWFLDCALSNIAARTVDNVITGLTHLANQEVGILIDGWVHPNAIVSADGSVELQDTGDKIVIGLPYESVFRSLCYQGQDTNTVGSTRRIHKIGVTLLKSLGLKVSAGGPEEEVYMGPTKIMNKAKELYSGTRNIAVPGGYDKEIRVVVKQDKPLPCEVTNIIAYFNAN